MKTSKESTPLLTLEQNKRAFQDLKREISNRRNWEVCGHEGLDEEFKFFREKLLKIIDKQYE